MEKDFEKQYHAFETDHFWFKSRRHFIINWLKQKPKNSEILDIGCSSGLLLEDLAKSDFTLSNLHGIDISSQAIENCKNKGLENTHVMDAQNIKLNKKFDFIVASDCLEHLKYDEDALKNWSTLLKENGRLLIFVPAYMFLWSYHDVINMHYRRYTKKELLHKALNNGFELEASGYWNFTLFFPVFIFRLISKTIGSLFNKKENQNDLKSISRLNNILFYIIKTENKYLKHFAFPFGVSTFCILKKN